MFNKRIIFDFDDTIAFPENRDFENAKPNLKLINKINNLYEDGFVIDIYTARGSISCSTREEADKKYRQQIENWLKKYDVKYHKLSFNKELALLYIDDKGMAPEKFLNLNINRLKGGLTASEIFTDGQYVYKNDNNCHNVKKWYDYVKSKLNVPNVIKIIGNNITIEYIDHQEGFFDNNIYISLGLIMETLIEMKKIPILFVKEYNSYVERIKNHIMTNNVDLNFDIVSKLTKIKLNQSFSHGDFGIKNLLFKSNLLYLIDPIPDVFGCIELDAAKFCASLLINNYRNDIYDLFFMNFVKILKTNEYMEEYNFKVLIIAELIRIYKYHNNKELVKGCINYVYR